VGEKAGVQVTFGLAHHTLRLHADLPMRHRCGNAVNQNHRRQYCQRVALVVVAVVVMVEGEEEGCEQGKHRGTSKAACLLKQALLKGQSSIFNPDHSRLIVSASPLRPPAQYSATVSLLTLWPLKKH